jgi:regulatory factor X
MLRANTSAHAAGSILIDDNNRNRMWTEYVRFSNPKTTMSAVIPHCNYDEEVYRILTFDVRQLLLPLSTPIDLEYNTHFQAAAMAHSNSPQPESFELDKMGMFFESLKARLPAVPSRELSLLIQAVSSRILRDIVMEHGDSYNCWLIATTFVDELILWLSHAGGFLERTPLPPPKSLIGLGIHNQNQMNGITGGPSGDGSVSSRYSSSGPDISMTNAPAQGPIDPARSSVASSSRQGKCHLLCIHRSDDDSTIKSRHSYDGCI